MKTMNRVEKICYIMKQEGYDSLLISDPIAIDYILDYSNHPGERLYVLLLNQDGSKTLIMNNLFFVDQEIDANLVWYSDTDNSIKLLAKHLKDCKKLGIDKTWPAKFLLPLQKILDDCHFVDGSFCVDYVRMIKDQNEQIVMVEASRINDTAMQSVIDLTISGLNEQEVATKLASIYQELGASGYSFEPIIAYGKNGANPHHENTKAVVQPGDSILIDMGCKYLGYCSDMTRTVFYKEVNELQVEVYNLVKRANLAAIAMIKPGVKLCDIDRAARDVITNGGYGEYFTHRLGHFIGKDVHEFGDVSSNFDIEVEPGMIFSIEPGIYLKDDFGVRIEDLVMVTDDGCVVLNNYSKDLIVVE